MKLRAIAVQSAKSSTGTMMTPARMSFPRCRRRKDFLGASTVSTSLVVYPRGGGGSSVWSGMAVGIRD
jgi:hypothetical protein